MKKCNRCGLTRPLTEFYLSRSKKGYTPYCKPCTNQQALERQRNLKKLMVDLKGKECIDCGFKGHYAAFDFHHVDPSTKSFSITSIRTTRINDKIRKELDKCVLLCSNCHRVRHAKY